MNMKKRIALVRAMDTVARSLNDEMWINKWLALGVADGDANLPDADLEVYCEDDEDFAELMSLFKRCVTGSDLYCDRVLGVEPIFEFKNK